MRANCEHGVLTLTIPVAEAAKPRRVQVGGRSDAQPISRRRPAARRPSPRGRSRLGETRWIVFNPAQVIQVSEPDR